MAIKTARTGYAKPNQLDGDNLSTQQLFNLYNKLNRRLKSIEEVVDDDLSERPQFTSVVVTELTENRLLTVNGDKEIISIDSDVTSDDLEELTDGSSTSLHTHSGLGVDEMVKVDSLATAGYLGAAYNDGVLRVTNSELSYTDGGNYVTLGLNSTLKSYYDDAYAHIHNLTTDINHDALTNTHQDVKVGAAPTWTRVNVSTAGDLRLYNALDTFYTGFKAPTLLASQIYTLPLADGAAGEALVTSGGGAGILSWTSVSTSPGGANTNVQYNNAGAFGGNANHTHDGSGTVYASVAYNTSSAGEYQINAAKMLAGAATVTECGQAVDGGTAAIFTGVGTNLGTSNLAGTRNFFFGDLIASRGAVAQNGVDNLLMGYKIAWSTSALSSASRNTLIGSPGPLYVTTADSNTSLGHEALLGLINGYGNTALGRGAGKSISSATGCTLAGFKCGEGGNSDYRTLFGYNIACQGANSVVVGTSCGITTGVDVTIMGTSNSISTNPSKICLFGSGAGLRAYDYMCAFGPGAGGLYDASKIGSCYYGYLSGQQLAGDNIVAIGRESGGWNSNHTTDNVILLGAYSGWWNNTADTLIVDCFKRANAAAEKVSSVLHGDMSATISSQNLRINANALIRYDTTQSPGTKCDGHIKKTIQEIQTTDATQTTLTSLTLEDENTYHVKAVVVGVKSDGSDRASYELDVTVYRTGAGSATIQGAITSIHSQESNASWDATFTVSGNDLRLSVTGIAATTIEWGGFIQYMNMSN